MNITQTTYEKGKTPQTITHPVPPGQEWICVILERQEKLLDKINDKLGFLVAVVIVAALVAIFF